MNGYSWNLATPLCIAWSMGGAQITYPIVGPYTLGMALCSTNKHEKTTWWKMFGLATLCLLPIVGGWMAGKHLE